MRNVSALTRREIVTYFLSPMPYVVLFVYALLSGIIFFSDLGRTQQADMRSAIGFMGVLLLFVSPMLTMRLFADEFQSGTVETLMTAPVTTLEVVLSKYLASLFFLLVTLAVSVVYPVVLFSIGEPDSGPVVAGYLGLFLVGSFFIAVGMVASACVRSQISSAIGTLFVLLVLWVVIPWVFSREAVDPLSKALRYLCFFDHFVEFFWKGAVDTRHVFFFVTTNLFCVFLTTVIVTVRRWR
jgi:ABC-2 type transport system permease protein